MLARLRLTISKPLTAMSKSSVYINGFFAGVQVVQVLPCGPGKLDDPVASGRQAVSLGPSQSIRLSAAFLSSSSHCHSKCVPIVVSARFKMVSWAEMSPKPLKGLRIRLSRLRIVGRSSEESVSKLKRSSDQVSSIGVPVGDSLPSMLCFWRSVSWRLRRSRNLPASASFRAQYDSTLMHLLSSCMSCEKERLRVALCAAAYAIITPAVYEVKLRAVMSFGGRQTYVCVQLTCITSIPGRFYLLPSSYP
jgi:hypothetical protein